jgi:pre-mRNA-splicing factor SYF1
MREMLRIRRSVQATYNTQVNMMSAQMLAQVSANRTVSDLAPGQADGMRLLEARAAAAEGHQNKENIGGQQESVGAIAGAGMGQPGGGGKIMFVRGSADERDDEVARGTKVQNPDEIDIDDDEEGEEEEEEGDEPGSKRRKVEKGKSSRRREDILSLVLT